MDDLQARPEIGMDVIDSDDHLVGTVESVEHDHFVVQKGFFFSQSHRIPNSAIGEIQRGQVTLRIRREEAMEHSADTHWNERPEHGEIAPGSATGTQYSDGDST